MTEVSHLLRRRRSKEGAIWRAALFRGFHLFFLLESIQIVDLIVRLFAVKKNKSGGKSPQSKEALPGCGFESFVSNAFRASMLDRPGNRKFTI